MVVQTSESPSIFTKTSLASLAAILVIYLLAHTSSKKFLPKDAKWTDRATYIWMTFDAIIHFTFEGSFLYLSIFGRQVITSSGPFAELWKEYARADARWGVSDSTIVSLEILTVLVVGPLAAYVVYLLIKDDPSRHYWIVLLSTAELYGGFMTFGPDWLNGSPSLNTSNWLYLWVYLFFMNFLWVIIPLALLFDSYTVIAQSLRLAQAQASKERKRL